MAQESSNGILEEFRIEFLDCWQKLPNKGFFLFLLAAWLALFSVLGNSTLGYVRTPSLMGWMYRVYNPLTEGVEAQDAHGNLVPFLVLGLFWWKRKELLTLQLRLWWPALLLVGFGLLLHVAGYIIQQPLISIVGLFTGLYGLTGLAWGPAWLVSSFFPFFLFAFMVPSASVLTPITFRLQVLVCKLVELVCMVLSIDIIREGTMLKDPTNRYQYEVVAACSGIRSLVSIGIMSIVYAYLGFRPWWKRGLLMVAAFPLAVLGNLVRMLFIVFASEIGGQKAGNFVHENFFTSLLPYIPAIVCLMLLGHWLRDPAPPKAAVEVKTV